MKDIVESLREHGRVIALSGAVFFAWILLFTLGMTIDSEKYRKILSEGGVEALASSPAGSAELDLQIADTLITTQVQGDTVVVQMNRPSAAADSGERGAAGANNGSQAETTDPAPSHTDTTKTDTARGSPGGRLGNTGSTRDERTTAPDDSSACVTTAVSSALFLGYEFWNFCLLILRHIGALIVVVFVFTPSNLAFITCLAGILGVIGRFAVLTVTADPSTKDRTFPILSAVIRSFFVYLIVISGMLVLLRDPILGTVSPGQYVRFAGMLSLTSFCVNYDPNIFADLLERVRNRLQEEAQPEQESAGSAGGPSGEKNQG